MSQSVSLHTDDSLSMTTMSISNNYRIRGTKKLFLKATIQHDDGNILIDEYCKRTSNYAAFGMRKWLLDAYESPDLINKICFFLRTYAIQHKSVVCDSIYTYAQTNNLLDFVGMPTRSRLELHSIIESLVCIIEDELFRSLIFDGLPETMEYKYFICDNEIYVSDYIRQYTMETLDDSRQITQREIQTLRRGISSNRFAKKFDEPIFVPVETPAENEDFDNLEEPPSPDFIVSDTSSGDDETFDVNVVIE